MLMEAVVLEIRKNVSAGSLESSDVMVTLGPSEKGGLDVRIDSIVEKQFGKRIRSVTDELLSENCINSGSVLVQDRGALECTLRARLETAIARASE